MRALHNIRDCAVAQPEIEAVHDIPQLARKLLPQCAQIIARLMHAGEQRIRIAKLQCDEGENILLVKAVVLPQIFLAGADRVDQSGPLMSFLPEIIFLLNMVMHIN
ncbi:hypothetical protein D3C72_2092900 [compost metagenome]